MFMNTNDLGPAGAAAFARQRANHTGTQPIDTVEGLNPQAAIRLSRSLQRLGDHGQTLHADFSYDAYGLGTVESCGVDNALEGEELFTVERAAPKWVEGPNGKLREVPPNTIAREWRNGEPKGALIEESRTNQFTWSGDFSQWGGSAGVQPDAILSPMGELAADKIVEQPADAGTVSHGKSRWRSPEEGQTTVSFFAKKGERHNVRLATYESVTPANPVTCVYNLLTGEASPDSATTAGMRHVGDGWWCCWASGYTAAANTSWTIGIRDDDNNTSYQGDGESGIYVWGVQLEEGSAPSSYIPTTDSPVTRAEDYVSRELGDEINPSEGTFTWDGYFSPLGGDTNYLLPIGTNSLGYTNGFLVWHTSNAVRLSTFGDGDASSLNVDVSSYPLRVPAHFSIAFSYKRDEYVRLAVNGVFAGEASLTGLPDLRRLYLHTTAGTEKERTVGSVNYIPRALTEQELLELTT